MTRRQRAQVVELLRCTVWLVNFDRNAGLYNAYAAIHGDEWVVLGQRHPHNKVWALAFAARNAVMEWQPYEAQCLEAAQRVEEGSWP